MDDKQLYLSSQVCFPLYSASRLITKAYKPYLDELGLTYPQYLVLMVLWENNGVSVNQITEKLGLNTNTLSPLLKRMEKMKLLQRSRSSEDERSVIIQLTESGKQLKLKARPIPEKLLTEILSDNIKIEDVLKLKDILNELIVVLSNKTESSRKI
ncbi:MAG: MarR family transcriptional regulator [Salinivirgaceae bacterium]|nr:MarR family transcriptional regulator [Salinivirgaceae bacterium]